MPTFFNSKKLTPVENDCSLRQRDFTFIKMASLSICLKTIGIVNALSEFVNTKKTGHRYILKSLSSININSSLREFGFFLYNNKILDGRV